MLGDLGTLILFLLCVAALCFPVAVAGLIGLVFLAAGWIIAAIITLVTGIIAGIALIIVIWRMG